jgi:16S rRNA (adenine1518-N6/adenine1519-N6)-dimethyltransferase
MKNVAKKSNTMDILQCYSLTASKKFGQNFLVDPNIIEKIVTSSDITKETAVIEIGPGIGALSEGLARKAGKLICYEIDERLKPVLKETLSEHENVTVIFQDFMKADLDQCVKDLSKDYKDICVVTNLPYYITSDIIMKVLKSRSSINRMIAMVQKEVALKFTSDEKSPMSVMIDYVGNISYVMTVSKNVFMPAPHVDSAVIRINKERNLEDSFIEVVEGAFKQKRKTILNNMKALFDHPQDVLDACHIDAKKRAQELTLEDYCALAQERKRV